MAELKTKPNKRSVAQFLKNIPDPARRRDCITIKRMMERATKSRGAMWGTNIVGFGTYRFQYPSGQSGEWFLTGFSPRKQALTLYIMAGFGFEKDLMRRLGKHTTGKACLYLRQLADVDTKVLDRLIRSSVKEMKARSA
jgi:hypothetical protein